MIDRHPKHTLITGTKISIKFIPTTHLGEGFSTLSPSTRHLSESITDSKYQNVIENSILNTVFFIYVYSCVSKIYKVIVDHMQNVPSI